MKKDDVLTLLKGIAKGVNPTFEAINRTVGNLDDRLKALEKANSGLCDSYRGVWQPGTYARNNTVTHRGSLWLCFRKTTGKPGPGDDWRLIVKAGRDAPGCAQRMKCTNVRRFLDVAHARLVVTAIERCAGSAIDLFASTAPVVSTVLRS